MTRQIPRPKTNVALEMRKAAEEAEAALLKKGLYLPSKPAVEIPQLPTEGLAELSDDHLMDLFSLLTRWADFLAGQVALAEIDERAQDAVVETAEATAMLADWGGKRDDKVTIARATRTLDADVQEMRQEQATRYAYRKLTQVLFGNVERDATLVSRELSRRIGRQEVNTRRVDRYRA